MKKKICEANSFWYFLKKSSFHFDVFWEELASLLNTGKLFSSGLEGWKVNTSPSAWTMVTSHEDADFSKLVKLSPGKRFSFLSTLGIFPWMLLSGDLKRVFLASTNHFLCTFQRLLLAKGFYLSSGSVFLNKSFILAIEEGCSL